MGLSFTLVTWHWLAGIRRARPVNQDGYVKEWPEVGLIAMNSPFDPTPSIKIENGRIVEMDGSAGIAGEEEVDLVGEAGAAVAGSGNQHGVDGSGLGRGIGQDHADAGGSADGDAEGL